LWANFWAFFAVLVTVAFLCYREFDCLTEAYGFGAPGPLGYGAGLLLLSRAGDLAADPRLALILMAAAMRGEDLAKSLPRAAVLLAALSTFSAAGSAPCPARAESSLADVCAVGQLGGRYGRILCGPALGPAQDGAAVSPHKSWEGAVASVAASIVIAGAYLLHFVPWIAVPQAVALTVAANAAGQLGDLTESP